MISDAFIGLGIIIVNILFAILPEGSGYSSEIISGFSTLGSYAGAMNVFLPLPTVGICLGIWYSVDLAIFAFRQLAWIFSKIPIFGK